MLCSLRVSFISTLKNLLNCISVSGTVMFVRGGPDAFIHVLFVGVSDDEGLASLDETGISNVERKNFEKIKWLLS